MSSRVRVGDVIPNASADAAAVEVGPSPALGVAKMVTRADIVSALNGRQVSLPRALPDIVRVLRKVRRLGPSDVDKIARAAELTRPLGKGVSLSVVRADRPVDVPDGWSRVELDVPRAPKKVGPFQTMAIVSFYSDKEVSARVSIPVELMVSTEGSSYDVMRGNPVTLIVRRGCVEVRTLGFAGTDADIGDRLSVQLRPSGRVLRTRLAGKDEAIVLEDGQ